MQMLKEKGSLEPIFRLLELNRAPNCIGGTITEMYHSQKTGEGRVKVWTGHIQETKLKH